MMIWVKIGAVQRTLQEATPDWINQTIVGMRRDGFPVCAQVTIQSNPINVIFSTPGCGGGGGGGIPRPLNAEELRMQEIWSRHRLNTSNFSGGDLVAFLKRISS